MSSEDIIKCEPKDYKNRSYLSAIEAAKYLGTTVDRLHWLVKQKIISAKISTSGQMRFELNELKKFISTPHNQIDNEKQINKQFSFPTSRDTCLIASKKGWLSISPVVPPISVMIISASEVLPTL